MRVRALVLVVLLLAPLPAGARDADERVVLTDPEGDADAAGAASTVDEACPAPCPLPSPGTLADASTSPALDLVTVTARETPDYLVITFEVARLDEDLEGLVDDEGRGRGAMLDACWVRVASGCNEGVRFTARRQDGHTFLSASYGYREEACNTRAVCGWGVPFELEFGSPGRVSVFTPRALAPHPLDEGATIGGLAAIVDRTFASAAILHPADGPQLVGPEARRTVDRAGPAEDFALATPRAGALTDVPAAHGLGPGLLVGSESEADLLDVEVVETPTTLTFAHRLATVSEAPIDQRVRVEWAFLGGRYHFAEVVATERQRRIDSGACNPSEGVGCEDAEAVPATFEVVPGSPGYVNVTYLRTDVGAPAAGVQTTRLASFVESSAASAAGAVTDFDQSGLAPPLLLLNATRAETPPPGAVRFDDSASDARMPAVTGSASADAFEITFVEAQGLPDGAARVTLGVRDPARFSLPVGYAAAIRAVALDEDGAVTMLAAYRDEAREAYFCAPDTLVLAGARTVPPESAWRTVPATVGVGGTSGNITFLVPAECLAPADRGGARPVSRIAGGTYLVRSSAAGAGEIVVVDEMIAAEPFTLSVQSAPGLLAPVAANGPVVWIALGLAVVAVGGAGALWVVRRPAARPAPPAPGRLFLGKYLVDREVGRGGFGAVWLATHTRLDRRVVIKQLQPGWASDAGAVERFRREARVLAKLDHPNIVRVYDAEEIEGLAFIVMEYVEGATMGDLRVKPASLATVERLGGQLLDALAAVHEAGIVHGDLKPDNVLVTSDHSVKLVDFGIARAATPDAMRTRIEGAEGAVGTPLFMAPEQLDGEPASPASDVYSATAVVHHLATGRLLFKALPIDVESARLAHEREAPDAGEGTLHPALVGWLRRGLARDPRDRYASAREMRDALVRAVAIARAA